MRTLASCLLHPSWSATQELKFQPVPWPCVLGPCQGSEVTLVRHVCGRGDSVWGPSFTQYVRQQISLFSPLLTAQVPTLYPRKCCQGRWARVAVREPRVMCGCSVCLDKCVVSKACLIILLLLLSFFFFFSGPFAFAAPGGPMHSVYMCVRASACMCECFHMSRQEWNPRGPTRLDSGY